MRTNVSLGDSLTGLHAAFGAVMALLHRQRHHGKVPGQVRHVADSHTQWPVLCSKDGCVRKACNLLAWQALSSELNEAVSAHTIVSAVVGRAHGALCRWWMQPSVSLSSTCWKAASQNTPSRATTGRLLGPPSQVRQARHAPPCSCEDSSTVRTLLRCAAQREACGVWEQHDQSRNSTLDSKIANSSKANAK